MLGASVFSVSDKFRMRIYTRNFEHYRAVPAGIADGATEIADAIFLYVGDEFDWDLELAIPAGRFRR